MDLGLRLYSRNLVGPSNHLLLKAKYVLSGINKSLYNERRSISAKTIRLLDRIFVGGVRSHIPPELSRKGRRIGVRHRPFRDRLVLLLRISIVSLGKPESAVLLVGELRAEHLERS